MSSKHKDSGLIHLKRHIHKCESTTNSSCITQKTTFSHPSFGGGSLGCVGEGTWCVLFFLLACIECCACCCSHDSNRPTMPTQSKLASTYSGMFGHFVGAVWTKPDNGGKLLLGVWGSSIVITLLVAISKRRRDAAREREARRLKEMEAEAERRRQALIAQHGDCRDVLDQEQTEAEKKALAAKEQQAARDKYVKGGMVSQLLTLLRVAFPSITCKAAFHLAAYTALLLTRILLTIKIAKVTGALGKVQHCFGMGRTRRRRLVPCMEMCQ